MPDQEVTSVGETTSDSAGVVGGDKKPSGTPGDLPKSLEDVRVTTIGDLRDEAPEVYKMMEKSIMTSFIGQNRRHHERLRKYMEAYKE